MWDLVQTTLPAVVPMGGGDVHQDMGPPAGSMSGDQNVKTDIVCGVVVIGLQAKDAWIPYEVEHWETRVLSMP